MEANETMCRGGPCNPLKTIDQLLSYRDYCCSFETVRNHELDDRVKNPLPDRPRVLLCHDFAGGYLEDRYYCSKKLSEDRKASGRYDPKRDYCFQHWNRIDIFVYFSHNFITVPPCTWIHQAHANGVKILGTIIIEWKPQLLEDFLETPTRDAVIKNLVDLCVSGKFDGWLFNIEVCVRKAYVKSLLELISQLKSSLAEKAPGSLVLWYDSLAKSGRIEYQNALTEENEAFFNGCDGIFLNYGWNKRNLDRSKSLAKDRKFDVYVGIDTFARATHYSGGFETTRVAKSVMQMGLSVAIFAPGWVLECNKLENFSENQEKFWGVLPVLR